MCKEGVFTLLILSQFSIFDHVRTLGVVADPGYVARRLRCVKEGVHFADFMSILINSP